MSRHSPGWFAAVTRAARAMAAAAILSLGLSNGALRSQAFSPPTNFPLPLDPEEINKRNQEIRRFEEEEKSRLESRWAWIAWIATPGGVVVVLLLIHGLRIWSERSKAMRKLQKEQKPARTRARAWGSATRAVKPFEEERW